MRYRALIMLGSITACLMQVPVSFSDGRTTAVSAVSISHAPIPTAELSTEALSLTESSAATLDEQQLAEVRKQFLIAEQAAIRSDRAEFEALSSGLKDYPLHDYLHYQWLRRHRGDDAGIIRYLESFSDSRYARPLRHAWLKNLGERESWQTLLSSWRPNADSSLNCAHAMALMNTGEQDRALQAASKLWSVGKSQPDSCDPLFERLMGSDYFTTDLVWQRFDAALSNNKVRLAKYISRQLPDEAKVTSRLWLNLHRDPARYLDELVTSAPAAHHADMFLHAVKRLSRQDLFLALETWQSHRQRFDLNAEQTHDMQRRLAMRLVLDDDDRAYSYLSSLAVHDASSREWQIRAALKLRDWPAVIESIAKLDEESKRSERWQYWLARAYLETGKPVQADEIYQALANQRDYFGYLAAEHLDRDYQLADAPLQISDGQIREVARLNDFRAAFELMALGRVHEAKSQWWHALAKLPAHQIAAAALLAQKWQWDEIAIFTIAKIEYWDDVALRFPMRYSEQVTAQADSHEINPAIVFGLIRRESAFNANAYSPVGARGLMQLMPATARQVSRELNYRWRGNSKLFEADRNIAFGTFYLRKMLDRFNGNYAMALAAYNAGPHRVRQWFPEDSVPADIWIETIPIRETREYVSKVLVYSMIYQQLLGSDDLTLAQLSGEIQPEIELASQQ